MGLDMFLYGVKYYSKYNTNREKTQIVQTQEIYWRKANHIHKWFVDTVQDGIDDCRRCEVMEDNLKQLLTNCEYVLQHRDRASEVLPTQEGFFFGNTEYDDWYFEETKRTAQEIKKVLESDYDWYEYSSSW